METIKQEMGRVSRKPLLSARSDQLAQEKHSRTAERACGRLGVCFGMVKAKDIQAGKQTGGTLPIFFGCPIRSMS